MPYLPLGRRRGVGISDATAGAQCNPFLPLTGWDVIFQPADLAVSTQIPVFEAYQIAVNGPVGSSLAVLIDGQAWNYVNQGWLNADDPAQTMLLQQGQSVQFCWNFAATAPPYNMTSNIQPVVTLWLRHEVVQ
jgi:hypothetical protein